MATASKIMRAIITPYQRMTRGPTSTMTGFIDAVTPYYGNRGSRNRVQED
jgi:hypothetical protein